MPQALTEALQAGQSAFLHLRRKLAFLIEARGQARGIAQSIDDLNLIAARARHQHVETVGTEIDRRDFLRARRGQAFPGAAHQARRDNRASDIPAMIR